MSIRALFVLLMASNLALAQRCPQGFTLSGGKCVSNSGGSGTVNNCATAGAIAYFSGTGTVVSCVAGLTVDANGNLVMTAAGDSGFTQWSGATSGGQAIGSAAVGGATILYLMPATAGVAGQVLQDTGGATCPTLPAGAPATCHQMAWAPASGGCMTPVTHTLSGAATDTFSSIPATCSTLFFDYSLTGAGGAILGQFNSDTGANYDHTQFFTGTSQATNPAGFVTGEAMTTLGLAGGTGQGWGTITIPNYTSTTVIKGLTSLSGRRDTSSIGYFAGSSGDWFGTLSLAAISIVKIIPTSGTLTGTITMRGQ